MEIGIIPDTDGSCCNVSRSKLEDNAPPALPPRPPPRARPNSLSAVTKTDINKRKGIRKYVSLCTLCGGLTLLSGTLLLSVYLYIRRFTTSLEHFETIPTYIPAFMLIITGFMVIFLARKQYRFIFLMKLCRICCIISPAACMYITVTTTFVHMSKLQELRKCTYTSKTLTCTCYPEEDTDTGTIFKDTAGCQVVHGILYSCLRALFGLSVFGVLICVFCCLLIYQLLSHEKKRNYWCQLEMRCRYLLYSSADRSSLTHCACCQHNANTVLQSPSVMQSSWDIHHQDISRFCTPGNLYTPNPVVDETISSVVSCQPTLDDPGQAIRTGWLWRLPWSRASTGQTSHVCYETPGDISAENQYGFQGDVINDCRLSSVTAVVYPLPGGPPPPYPMNHIRGSSSTVSLPCPAPLKSLHPLSRIQKTGGNL